MPVPRSRMRLYAVTGGYSPAEETRFFQRIAEAIDGGAGIVQLREKRLDDAAFLPLAAQFVAVCRERGALSILNDRVEIAARVGADGVHLGQQDMEITAARRILGPGKVIGVSAHTVEEALRAQAAGADHLGVGAVFATGTKQDARPIRRETIRAITQAVSIPVVAIGGITAERLPALRGLGLDGVAVVSGLFGQPDVRAAAEELRRIAEEICGP